MCLNIKYFIYANNKGNKDNKDVSEILDEFTRVARSELIKYATRLWDKHLSSKYEDFYRRDKMDKVDELQGILYKINYSGEKTNLIEVFSRLVEFRSVLAAFESLLAMKKNNTLFVTPLNFIAHFFKLSPGITASLQKSSRAKLLIKNLETLVEKTQESIISSLSTQELRLAYSAFKN